MTLSPTRRLPGFRFEVQAPPVSEVLPRMDIAVFVGFAACGPLQTPVPVTDIGQFTAIFGDELLLAWDPARGEQVYALLAPAVRAFFRHGGQRCWIVRVAADTAQINLFSVPGLASLGPDGTVTPAFAQARAAGSWSDALRVGSALLSRPLRLVTFTPGPLLLELELDNPGDVAPGDLLRLSFRPTNYGLLLPVVAVNHLAAPDASHRVAVQVTAGQRFWFKTSFDAGSPLIPDGAATFQGGAAVALPVVARPMVATAQSVTVDLAVELAAAPAPGTLLQVKAGSEDLWLVVQQVRGAPETGDPSAPQPVTQVVGEGLWRLPGPPADLPPGLPLAEQLTFELWVQHETDYPVRLAGLGFASGHPRFWGDLPTDGQLYAQSEDMFKATLPPLWQEIATPRFPLAGPLAGPAGALYLPIAMPVIPQEMLGPLLPANATGLERDGLADFHTGLFVDPRLSEVTTQDLLNQADFFRYTSSTAGPLLGLHAALSIEEATLIAVPDLVHRGWTKTIQEQPPLPQPLPPPARPEWWHFLPCDPAPALPRVSEPEWGNFLDCTLRVIDAPQLEIKQEGEQAEKVVVAVLEVDTFTLAVTPPAGSGLRYTLEEATQPDFSDAVTLYTGPANDLTIYGRSPGDYYYHVRAALDGAVSDWSNGVVARVAAAGRYLLNKAECYAPAKRDQQLLAVQRILLRMCAARGDLLAVLALPEHYREDQAVAHPTALERSLLFLPLNAADYPDDRRNIRPGVDSQVAILPLSAAEARALSYGALYHPWLVGRTETGDREIRRSPPDGAACGVLARRALVRGAWVAPANEPLRGVVALEPPIARERWLELQTSQVNLVRQEARGFMALSADTLSQDSDLRPINVRRLLILLRRLALRMGARYVFEPNSPAFRRLVQRGFEELLDGMFVRGAFAGKTPASSYSVNTGVALNPPQSVDLGRLIVEIRVAPSQPLTFVTIRLVQTGDRGLVTEER